jgi:peptidoglycan/LPS O-acetylase OafA/YrhL
LIYVVFNIPGQISVHKVTFVTFDYRNVIANFAFFQNFAGGSDSSILSPMWSLAYEWQMYVLLPLFYFIARRASSIVPLIAIWSVPVLIEISYGSQIDAINKRHDFWTIPDWGIYGPCFIAGIMAFFIAYKLKPEAILPWPTVPLVIAALSFPMMANTRYGKFIPATLLIAMLIPYCREIPHGWFSEAARIVVRYSYGIYIFHLLGIYFAFVKLKHQSHPVQWLTFVAIIIVVPFCFYHLLELPAIKLGNRLAKRLEPSATLTEASTSPP